MPQDFSVVPSGDMEETAASSASASAPFEWEATSIPARSRTGTDPDLAATAQASAEAELPPATAPGFEPTSLQETHEVAAGAGADPSLVTDVADMSAAF